MEIASTSGQRRSVSFKGWAIPPFDTCQANPAAPAACSPALSCLIHAPASVAATTLMALIVGTSAEQAHARLSRSGAAIADFPLQNNDLLPRFGNQPLH